MVGVPNSIFHVIVQQTRNFLIGSQKIVFCNFRTEETQGQTQCQKKGHFAAPPKNPTKHLRYQSRKEWTRSLDKKEEHCQLKLVLAGASWRKFLKNEWRHFHKPYPKKYISKHYRWLCWWAVNLKDLQNSVSNKETRNSLSIHLCFGIKTCSEDFGPWYRRCSKPQKDLTIWIVESNHSHLTRTLLANFNTI